MKVLDTLTFIGKLSADKTVQRAFLIVRGYNIFQGGNIGRGIFFLAVCGILVVYDAEIAAPLRIPAGKSHEFPAL